MSQRPYHSEADKVRDLPHVMQYIQGRVLDAGCGHDKIIPTAIGMDARTLPGVDIITDDLYMLDIEENCYDTIFSSHLLEHIPDIHDVLLFWRTKLKYGGHIVIYMPDARHYNNTENLEHLWNWTYEDFLFFIKRAFCGEGKDYTGEHLTKWFELVNSGMDVRHLCYSFYVILQKI